ncbi:MAG: hypothetical protein BBJ57_00305 [Desulfobacterales bacterium PC51MH44]|nr:MAG: hypothetical protein BBJ57_00305 [Desulfobacterales bacterium PC51MH44]
MGFKRWFVIMLLAMVMLVGCSRENNHERNIVAKVNDCNITEDECRYALGECYKKGIAPLTEAEKGDLLDQMIKKELLIQEAKRRNLDQDEDFRRTIEKYWEQTLIRNLLNQVGEDFSVKIHVSKEDISDFKKELGVAEAAMSEKEIEEEIFERKKTEALKKWLEKLKRSASIEINREAIDAISR